MKVVTVTFIVIAAAAVMTAGYFVWMNRASEKIMTAVIPITLAALAGIFLSIFVFGGEPPIIVNFYSTFEYDTRTRLPINGPELLGAPARRLQTGWFADRRFMFAFFAPSQLNKEHPEYFNDPNDDRGILLYHQLLQRSILEWISTHYHVKWQMEDQTFESTFGREERWQPSENATEPADILTTSDLAKLLEGNHFANFNMGLPLQIAVPSDMKLSVTVPRTGFNSRDGKPLPPTGNEVGNIQFSNDFCTLSIQTHFTEFLTGVGQLQSMVGLTEDQNQRLTTSNYSVKIQVLFDRMRNGHPKMPLYKLWATGIADGLKRQFDEELIWNGIKEDFLFRQQVGH